MLNLVADDFRSVLGQARSMVKQLVAYRANYQGQAQPSPLSYTGFSPIDAPTNGSLPPNPPLLMNERDLDRSRTGLMTSLVSLLQKNLRIRYELVFEDVVEA
jgi:rapamycin-insensitive companion of mTOR